MMRLHHAEGSAHSASVRIALAEKGIPYESRQIDLAARAQHGPDFLAINPSGLLPVLEDGTCRLTETTHILLYLDEAHPRPPLGGGTPRERYQVLKWGKYVETHIAPHLALLLWAARPDPAADPIDLEALKPLPPERRALWEAAAHGFAADEVAAARQALAKAAGRLAADLAESPWLAGEQFTLADIALYPHVAHFAAVGVEPPLALAAWLQRMGARPAVAADAPRDRPVATMGPERARWG